MARLTDDRSISDLCGQASKMLFEYGKRDIRKDIRNSIKKLMGRGSTVKDMIFWPAGMLLLGLLEAQRYEEVSSYLDNWIEKGVKVCHTDDAITGYCLVRMYEKTGRTEYKEAADKIADFLFEARKDAKGSIVYNAESENPYIYADGAGQTAMFLSHYGLVFDDSEAKSLAALQLINFRDYGMDEKSGLPYHVYDYRTKVKYGIIGWGRAVGWLLLGTSQYTEDIIAENNGNAENMKAADKEIAAMNEALIRASLEYADMRDDGLFAWQLSCTEGPCDTSACGMIFYACAKTFIAGKGFAELFADDREFGDKDEREEQSGSQKSMEYDLKKQKAELGDRLADAVCELADFINGGQVMQCSAECTDYSQYRQKYSCYPWGQGSVLAFLAIM